MPTGYTSYIEDGEITTGKDFLKLCTRAFGVAVDLKDEPLSVPTPEFIEPDRYYEDKYNEALEKLKSFINMSKEDIKKEMKEKHDKNIEYYKRCLDKANSRNKKYEKVRKEVEDWNPPTPEHVSLKKFALEQIDMCMESQTTIDSYTHRIKKEFDDSDEAVEKYIKTTTDNHRRNIDWFLEKWIEALKSVKEKNEWMRQFLNSL